MCARCKKVVETALFHKNKTTKDGFHSYCKPCVKAYDKEKYPNGKPGKKARHYRKHYGLTLEQLEEMRQAQNGKCAICQIDPERPVVDHCHATGKVRGILCDTCNRAIGLLKDDPEVLIAAAGYLRGGQDG